MNIDWFIVGVIVSVILLIVFVYRYHTKGSTEIAPSSFVTEALSGLEAPKSVDPEDDPLGQLAPMLSSFEFKFPERDNFIKVKAEHGDSKLTEKALFERALGCVAKITHVQRCYPAIQQAKQGNILPDDVWNMTQMKMKEVDDEYQDIRKEADSMVANGGATIFQEAARVFQQIQQQMAAQHQQRMAQAQAQAKAAGAGEATPQAAIQGAPTQPTPAQLAQGPIPIPAQLPTPPKVEVDKQTELKKKLEQQQAEKKQTEQVKKPEDAQTIAQKKAAADKAYKELLREEAQGGKKSKKSKKDE